ncbi:complex I subunit 5 family protein [Candidatus Margulisiibacteriota bacterium]
MPLFVAVPLLVAFAIPLVARIRKGLVDSLALLTVLSLVAFSIIAVLNTFPDKTLVYTMGGHQAPIGIILVLDSLSVLLLLTVAVVSTVASLFSINYMNRFTGKPKFYTLLLLMIAGMNGVILTGDFFNMYVFIEIAAISSYALVAFGTESEEIEASFKYMVLGSVASAFILLAVIFIYACCGTLNMAHVSQIIAEGGMNSVLWISLSLFIMGFSVKAALVPFHAWLPDAHPSAPAPISAMLSGVLIKAIGAYALIRIIFNVFGLTPTLSWILMILGTLSMVIGVFLAIGQWDYKRLLAYHSISQMGYVIFGIGLGTPLGILGGLFHLLNHATFKSLLFLNSGAVEYKTDTRDLKELGGLKEKMPVTSTTSLIASMSIAGIPPFNGFWSKLFIIIAGVMSGHYIMTLLAVIVSIVTLASFLKVEKFVYFGKLKEKFKNITEVPFFMGAAMVILAFVCIGVGLAFPYVINVILDPAVNVLLKGVEYAGRVLGG